jgi:hypothetical protein
MIYFVLALASICLFCSVGGCTGADVSPRLEMMSTSNVAVKAALETNGDVSVEIANVSDKEIMLDPRLLKTPFIMRLFDRRREQLPSLSPSPTFFRVNPDEFVRIRPQTTTVIACGNVYDFLASETKRSLTEKDWLILELEYARSFFFEDEMVYRQELSDVTFAIELPIVINKDFSITVLK